MSQFGSYASVAGLLDLRRLRAVALAVRRDASAAATASPGSPDPGLLALTDRPFESVAGARERLARLADRLRRRGDRRAVFLAVYTRMTRAVGRSIERGVFADPEWMREYTVTFANYYREAFLAFERGDLAAVPEPWRIAFGTAIAGDALVAQDAFLGINAHINYDLALTLDDVGIDPKRERKRADHRSIDEVLARLVDAQQAALAELYAPGLDDVDAALGRLDESLALGSLTEGRAQAWRVAVVLADVDWGVVDAYARWVLRTTATGGALFVLGPTLRPAVRRALERVERDRLDLGTTLDVLHEHLDAIDPV